MRNMPTKEGKANPWNHPFWSVTQSAWIETKDLKEGELLSLGNGSQVAIESILHYDTEETTVYNFEVEGNHTYYVSEAGVLVHNQSPSYAPVFASACAAGGALGGPAGCALGIIGFGALSYAATHPDELAKAVRSSMEIGTAATSLVLDQAVAACASIDCINKVKKEFEDMQDKFHVENEEDLQNNTKTIKVKVGNKRSAIGVALVIDNNKSGFDKFSLSPEVGIAGTTIGYVTDENGKIKEVNGKIGKTEVSLDRNGEATIKHGGIVKPTVTIDINKKEINKVGVGIQGSQKFPSGDSLSIGAEVNMKISPVKLNNIFQNQNSGNKSNSSSQCGGNMSCLNLNKSRTGCGEIMSCP
jgi:hypothetical protein